LAAAYAMNKAGLERNENIFRFMNPKGRLRNRLGDALRWPALVRIVEAAHSAGEGPVKGSGFTCRTAMNSSSAAIATGRSSSLSNVSPVWLFLWPNIRDGYPNDAKKTHLLKKVALIGVIRSNWTGSRAVRLKTKAAHKVLAVTEVE